MGFVSSKRSIQNQNKLNEHVATCAKSLKELEQGQKLLENFTPLGHLNK